MDDPSEAAMANVDNVLHRACEGPAAWQGPDLLNSNEWVLRLSPSRPANSIRRRGRYVSAAFRS